jgi:hypothetical protein
MAKLHKINYNSDESLLNKIFSSEIVVFEDVQGSKIFVNWDGKTFTIKPKSITSEPINLVDMAMQKYYNMAILFFENLDDRVKGLLNRKWWFGFEYFPDNQPANIIYNRIPKNHLVLTSISKAGKFDYTSEELEEYSRLLNVDSLPIIFKGSLGDDSIEAIKYFLNTSEDDLEYVFGERSFAYFFYKLLNPQKIASFLMNDDFQTNMEKIIIRMDGSDVSFEILNPLYKRISAENTTDFVQIYSLIIINFLNFCQTINLKDMKITGEKRDELYLSLICKLFNIYMAEVKDDLVNFDFTVPEFFNKEKFRINLELIPNSLTKDYLKSNKKFEYIFKCILGSFNKKRKKPIGILNDITLVLFNNFVDDLSKKIDEYYKRKTEIELTRSGLLDFGTYFDIKYDVDAEEKVYPDVYNKLKDEEGETKKKKGMGKFGVPEEEKSMSKVGMQEEEIPK